MTDNPDHDTRDVSPSSAEPPSKVAQMADSYVGRQLRKRRTDLGLTQQELARVLNITYQQVQKYETGGNRVNAGKLFILAKALDVPIEYFFQGFDTDQSSNTPVANNEMVRMARLASGIRNDAVKRSLLGLMRTLSQKDDDKSDDD